MTNQIVFPAEYGRERGRIASSVQDSPVIYTIYARRRNGDYIDITGASIDAKFELISTGTVYDSTGTFTVTDGAGGEFTWLPSAADLGIAGDFYLQFTIDGERSEADLAWEIEARLDSDGSNTPTALVALTAAQVALVQAISALTGLANFDGTGSATAIKLNLAATTDPTADDDSGDGYTVWSGWANVQDNKAWLCLSAAAGAAVWLEITGGGAVWGSITGDLANQTDLVAELDAISSTITTLANLIAAAQSGLNNHVADTDNPHQVTAAQIGAGTGDVTGPASSTDNQIARFDLTTGKIIQAGTNAPTYDDTGKLIATVPISSYSSAVSGQAFGDGATASTSGTAVGFNAAAGSTGTAVGRNTISGANNVAVGFGANNTGISGRVVHLTAGGLGRTVYGWSGESIVGTPLVVFPNVIGDVTLVLSGTFTVSDGAGNVAGGVITATAPGGTFNLFDDGGTNTCQLQVAADGSVSVIRTAGSRTYAVNLNLNWM